jgi:peroxiredoxin
MSAPPTSAEPPTDSSERSNAASQIAWAAQLLFAVLAGLVVYSFVDMAKHAEVRRACDPLIQLRPRYLGADRTVPDFELKDGNGVAVKLSSFRGKVVVLHFWTKTCKPCLEELPFVRDFAERMKARKDVVVLTVTIDDGPDAVKDVLQTVMGAKAPPFTILYDPDNTVIRGKFGTQLFPETWLIDSNGIIRARFDGVPMAGEGCDVAWSGPLMGSAIDAIEGPVACDVTIDAKVDPRPEHLVAPCR